MGISVIIPTLNEETTIADTLRHTARLGFDDIVVVDGGSTDHTQTIVRSILSESAPILRSSLRLIVSPPGRARQMNAGAVLSRSDTLLFLHADTRLPDGAAGLIANAMSNSAVVGGRFDVRFDNPSTWARIISAFMNGRSRWSRISTGDQAIFVRRKIFDRLGGFRDIPVMEDIDFSARLKRLGTIASLRETVTTSFRRWEENGPLRTVLLMWILRFLYWLGISPQRLSGFYVAVR